MFYIVHTRARLASRTRNPLLMYSSVLILITLFSFCMAVPYPFMYVTSVVGSYKGSAGVEDKRPIVNVRPREGRVGRALWAQAVCVWQR